MIPIPRSDPIDLELCMILAYGRWLWKRLQDGCWRLQYFILVALGGLDTMIGPDARSRRVEMVAYCGAESTLQTIESQGRRVVQGKGKGSSKEAVRI